MVICYVCMYLCGRRLYLSMAKSLHLYAFINTISLLLCLVFPESPPPLLSPSAPLKPKITENCLQLILNHKHKNFNWWTPVKVSQQMCMWSRRNCYWSQWNRVRIQYTLMTVVWYSNMVGLKDAWRNRWAIYIRWSFIIILWYHFRIFNMFNIN